MIKGVNKQIVEINYTKNDYIEKAILIINPNKSSIPKAIISQKAEDYMQTVMSKKPDEYLKKIKHQAKTKRDKKIVLAIIIMLSVLLTITVATIIFLMISP